MSYTKVLKDEDFGLKSKKFNKPKIRYGARGIVIKEDNKIAIFNKSNKNEYKLPGGEIENGESKEYAFKREVLEETGCEVKIVEELGIIEERKSLENFKQISYIFVGVVTKNTYNLNLTKKEIDEGAKLIWVDKEKGLELIKNSINNIKGSEYENIYNSIFIIERDKFILENYLSKNSKKES